MSSMAIIGTAFAVVCSALGLAGLAWLAALAWGAVIHRAVVQREVDGLVRAAIAYKVNNKHSDAESVRMAAESIERDRTREEED